MNSKIKLNANLRKTMRIVLLISYLFVAFTAMKTLFDGKPNYNQLFLLSFVILATLVSLAIFTESKEKG